MARDDESSAAFAAELEKLANERPREQPLRAVAPSRGDRLVFELDVRGVPVGAVIAIQATYPEVKLEHRVERARLVVGRKGSDVDLPSYSVSRRHVEVAFTADGVQVTDLNSASGTFVNGVRVKRAWLNVGDKLCVGDVIFIVRAAT